MHCFITLNRKHKYGFLFNGQCTDLGGPVVPFSDLLCNWAGYATGLDPKR